MKTITIILLLFTNAVLAQVKVNEIKMKFGSEYHKAKEPDVTFPVMSTGNKEVDDKINFIAINALTGEDSVANFSTVLFRAMNEGLSELDYVITLNTKDILSYRFDALGCGAYCESYSLYFNFDLHTGELLKIEDVLNNEKLDSFRAIVLRDKVKALESDLHEKKNLLSMGKIDSTDYHFVSEHIQQCISEVNTDKFLLFKNDMQVIDACEFPHVVKALQPVYVLKYSYSRYKRFFKPEFLQKIN